LRATLALAAGAAALAAWSGGAIAAPAPESPLWPPAPALEARMRDLQQIIGSRDSTREQRDAARSELGRLMMAPDAKGAPVPRGPRAAIEPFPSVVKPPAAAPPLTTPPAVAELEVVAPSRRVVDPKTGAAAAPSGRFAIDPRTGNVLHETPAGYIDPRTGRLIPR
jgi:hypothetical protein